MGWRRGELWFDSDGLWGVEPAFAVPGGALELPRFGPSETGLDASRRRRQAAKDLRKRRFQTRTAPAVAVVIGSSAVLPALALRARAATGEPLPLLDDPPSLTLTLAPPVVLTPRQTIAEQIESPRIHWRHASADGLPYAGHLHDGTRLPVESADWVTWNPGTDSSPNLPSRLYGHERTIRRIVDVVAAYRAAHPKAPRVVIGDVSFRYGGPMDQHVSHQNGLDVDVYYPRRDGQLRAPTSTAQIDRRLSQILLDAFLDAGAKIVFVGYTTDLRGPGGVVVPYPNHENHMHVRFANPG